MYKDMVDYMADDRHCDVCGKVARHALVEYVLIDELIGIVEVIDSWWECTGCNKTTAIVQAQDDFPF